MKKKNNAFSNNSIFVVVLLLILSGTMTLGGDSDQPTNTCSDRIDNDGDGYVDFNPDDPNSDLDCNPDAPFYTGEEDGQGNQYQNQNSPP